MGFHKAGYKKGTEFLLGSFSASPAVNGRRIYVR